MTPENMRKLILAITVVGLMTTANSAVAEAPDLIPVQGVLMDTAGVPIDTSVTAVFSLYTSEVGGTAIWTETQSVLVENGLFTAYLGEVTTLVLTTFRDNDDLWLGIQIESDPEMDRVYLGATPFSGYAEYCGNIPAHSHTFGDLTGTIDPGTLPGGVVVGPLACTGTEKVSGVDSTGDIVCAADVDTNYSAGTGLDLTGTVFSADTGILQARVSSSCPPGESISAINSDGTVVCETDTDTTYTAGTGLVLTGTTFSIDTVWADAQYVDEGQADSVTSAMIVDDSVTRDDIYGTEVGFYGQSSLCADPGRWTFSPTCPTVQCLWVPSTRYYDCSGSCSSWFSMTCPNTLLGYFLAP